MVVHIKTVRVKEDRQQLYKDLIVTGGGLAFASAGFGLFRVSFDDPGVEYGLVSLMFLSLSYWLLGSLFGMKV